MSPLIVLSPEIAAPYRDALSADYRIAARPEEIAGARAVVIRGSESFDAARFEAMPALSLICCIGSGHDGVDAVEAARRGVTIATSGDANAAAVADHALALLLASVRQVVSSQALLRAGDWRSQATRIVSRPGLTGRRAGIVGLGAIGRRIAARLSSFDCEIGYTGRTLRDSPHRYFETPLALAQWADVLILSHRANADNAGLADRKVLDALGPDGCLVNVSRGSAVIEDDLVAALREGRLGGAAIDVFEGEPQPSQALIACPNLIVTPHIAGGTREALQAMFAAVRQTLKLYFADEGAEATSANSFIREE
uniref:D-isomer specific 2-hydroxyacid dehydrogenase NAD-binding n=1 Tax=Caulobacter sp. (strain K31) TaxID=366602 RepID=B0T6M3_CAUSK